MLIRILDGADTIGGTKIYVEEDKEGIVLDFGFNYARASRFFQEYLKERSVRGIHDAFTLKLIPEFNIYRKDLITPDIDISSYPDLPIKAVILSHAHLDHCGCAGYLDESIPVIASPETILILKALKDTGSPGVGQEVVYFSKRTPDAECPYVVKAKPGKSEPNGRTLIFTKDCLDEVVKFIMFKPSSREWIEIPNIKIGTLKSEDYPLKIEAFEVDHSIPGACAFRITGKNCSLVYTGDLRFHGRDKDKTLEFLKKVKNPDVLIIEGTRVGTEDDVSISEDEVMANCYDIIKTSEGIVVADFSARNFERLQMFRSIAREIGKKLVITAKDAYFLYALSLKDESYDLSDLLILKEWENDASSWKKFVFEKFNNQLIEPKEIAKNQNDFILCISFYDFSVLLDIKPSRGTYIYSSSEAFDEEAEFDFLRMYNWLDFFSFKVYGFEIESFEDKVKPKFIKGFHASGHLSTKEIEEVIEDLNPSLIIPIHTSNPQWFAYRFKNVKILSNQEDFEI